MLQPAPTNARIRATCRINLMEFVIRLSVFTACRLQTGVSGHQSGMIINPVSTCISRRRFGSVLVPSSLHRHLSSLGFANRTNDLIVPWREKTNPANVTMAHDTLGIDYKHRARDFAGNQGTRA